MIEVYAWRVGEVWLRLAEGVFVEANVKLQIHAQINRNQASMASVVSGG